MAHVLVKMTSTAMMSTAVPEPDEIKPSDAYLILGMFVTMMS